MLEDAPPTERDYEALSERVLTNMNAGRYRPMTHEEYSLIDEVCREAVELTEWRSGEDK